MFTAGVVVAGGVVGVGGGVSAVVWLSLLLLCVAVAVFDILVVSTLKPIPTSLSRYPRDASYSSIAAGLL